MIHGCQSISQVAAVAGLIAVIAGCAGTETSDIPIIGNIAQSEFFNPPTPTEAAVGMFNVYDADVRRRSIGLIASSDFGGEPPYLRGYRLLIDDPDPTVRAACINALGRHGETADVSIILPYLADRNELVRWQAAIALQRLHRPDAVSALIAVLSEDTSTDVRMAAANALGQYPERRVFDALVGALSDTDYGVIREANQSLQTLTGESFEDRGSVWLTWAEEQENLFANQQPYYFPQYQPNPGIMDRLMFRDAKRPEQQQPRGIEPLGPADNQPAENS